MSQEQCKETILDGWVRCQLPEDHAGPHTNEILTCCNLSRIMKYECKKSKL